jgi:hypothetical protein
MQHRLRHSGPLGHRIGSSAGGGGSSVFTDGDCTWRLIADDDEAFNWQHTLTELGFDGTEDVDYYTPQEIE